MFVLSTTRIVKSLSLNVLLLCLIGIFQVSAQADTLTIIGSSDSQDPIVFSSGQISFLGQAFNNNFNVTAVGQTFDFAFGQYSIGPPSGIASGDSGCTDGPCFPITLTGSLTTPLASLTFAGLYEETDGVNRTLTVDWQTGSGPFTFVTPEGGVVIFTVELVHFFGNNTGATPLLSDQMARLTVTGFQPGQAVPEPVTIVTLGTSLVALFVGKRIRKRS